MKDLNQGKTEMEDTALDVKATASRRKVVAGLAAGGVLGGGALLPRKWTRPVIETVILPAHARTTNEDPSDNRLKSDIETIVSIQGISFCRWEWNESAKTAFGLTGKAVGVIAQDIARVFPDVVGRRANYLTVDYRKLKRHLFG